MLETLINAIDQLTDNESIDYSARLDWACVVIELTEGKNDVARAIVASDMDSETRELLLEHHGDDFAVRRAAGELLGVVA